MTNGSICGGVMISTTMRKGIRKHGPYFEVMAFVMPDDKYKKYVLFKGKGKNMEAKKIFDKYAVSII